MKTYLSDKIDNAIVPDSRGISSVSNEDAQIIFNLLYCIEQMAPTLFDIIQDWKILPDSTIIDQLAMLVEGLESKENNKLDKGGRNFVKLGGEWLLPEVIISYKFIDGYDEDDEDHPTRYNIILNKGVSEKQPYANKIIEFYSPKQRDVEFKKYMNQANTFHSINFVE